MQYPFRISIQHFGCVWPLSIPSNRPESQKDENVSLWPLTWPWPDTWPQSYNVNHWLGAPWWELSNACSPVSLRRLVLQLRKMIHTDVWAWRPETHRRARADHILTLHPPNSKSYEPIFDFFFQKMHRSFLVRYGKSRENQAISLFDICEKHEGRSKSASPFPGVG